MQTRTFGDTGMETTVGFGGWIIGGVGWGPQDDEESVGTIPVAEMMPIFGIDKFVSECRALTNLCGNAIASIVVSRWEGQFDLQRARKVLDNPEDDLEILTEEPVITGEEQEATPARV